MLLPGSCIATQFPAQAAAGQRQRSGETGDMRQHQPGYCPLAFSWHEGRQHYFYLAVPSVQWHVRAIQSINIATTSLTFTSMASRGVGLHTSFESITMSLSIAVLFLAGSRTGVCRGSKPVPKKVQN